MKKFLLLLSAVIFLAACEKKGGGNLNYAEGYKYLSSLNVSDAKLIYRKSETKAEGYDTYWKLDFSGNEKKLTITGQDGKIQEIGIGTIVKLSDRILLMQPNIFDMIRLLPGYDEDAMISISDDLYLMIVDVKTEKLYKWPDDIHLRTLTEGIKSVADSRGNVYFTVAHASRDEDPQIYKLNISDFTMQPMLPDGHRFTDFTVTEDGFLVYWERYGGVYRVKCPGGRLYPITGIGFSVNNNVYSLENNKIYLWEGVGDNSLEKREVCDIEYHFMEGPLLKNAVKNTVIFRGGRMDGPAVVEFDGKTISEPFLIPEEFYALQPIDAAHLVLSTNKAWYLQSPLELHKLDMATYKDNKIPLTDYEIQTLIADETKPDLTFTGIRYDNGASVVGRITDTDEFIIDEAGGSGNKIYDLISLN